ncbi:MAG TPA: hypothetical protein PK794_05565, partial [Armatimonadota bacterium]|nr:hypothetical protein [Armatimonadota bacterium]
MRKAVVMLAILACGLGARADILINYLTTDRITYAPGAKGTISLRLENNDDAPVNGTLVVTLYEELDRATVLLKEAVPIPATARVEKTVPLEVGTALWGRGVEARYTAGQQTV